MPRRFVYEEESEQWAVCVRLRLDDDGTFELTRSGQGYASHLDEALRGRWSDATDSIELRPDTDVKTITLRRLADGGLDEDGIELRPVDADE